MKNIRFFYLKNCPFLVVKFSVYLNRHVFVMGYAEMMFIWRDSALAGEYQIVFWTERLSTI